MYAVDRATQSLGITIDAMAPGSATLRMTVRPDMLNGLAGCHGGLITTLADSAFAFACNSYNELTVASGLAIELMAPAREGDVLIAEASEVSRRGRLGLYDVVVTNQRGERVALMRGRSYTAKGKRTVELPDTATLMPARDTNMKRPLSPVELDPIERASRDELQALQLQRLRWSLQHAYDNVAHYRKAFDAHGVQPSD